MPAPFESQFFNDDATDIGDYGEVDQALGADDATMLGEGEVPPSASGMLPGEEDEDDLWAGTQGITLKRARPENVNFAKKAKRVDVKRLKDDIWGGLRGLVEEKVSVPASSSVHTEIRMRYMRRNTHDQATESNEDHPMPDTTPQPTDSTEHKTFNNIITTLRTSYPREKMSEISTSFCFICLLHLANEEGLKLESARFDGLEGEDVGCQGVWEMDLPPAEQGTGTGMGKGKNKQKGMGRMGEGESEDRVVGELQALRVFKVSLVSLTVATAPSPLSAWQEGTGDVG